MIRYESQCCDCATESYPCLGNECLRRNVPIMICDKCGEEVEDLYEYGHEQLCKDCVLERMDKVIAE